MANRLRGYTVRFFDHEWAEDVELTQAGIDKEAVASLVYHWCRELEYERERIVLNGSAPSTPPHVSVEETK